MTTKKVSEKKSFDASIDANAIISLIAQKEPLLVEWAMAQAMNDKYRQHYGDPEPLT